MSDESLRELERQWTQETGSLEAEAAFLLERMRMGQLSQDRLEVAAYFGQPAARAALSLPPPLGEQAVKNWRTWLLSVPHGLHVVLWRAGLAALEEAGPVAAGRVLDLGEGGPTVEELVAAVASWLTREGGQLTARIPMRGWPVPGEPLLEPPVVDVALAIISDAIDVVGADRLVSVIRTALVGWALP